MSLLRMFEKQKAKESLNESQCNTKTPSGKGKTNSEVNLPRALRHKMNLVSSLSPGYYNTVVMYLIVKEFICITQTPTGKQNCSNYG